MKTVLLALAVIWGGSLVVIVLGVVCMWLFGREAPPPTQERARAEAPPEPVTPAPLPEPPVPRAPVVAASPSRPEDLVVFRKLHRTRRARDGSARGVDRPA